MKKLKYLVVGTGRSGSVFLARTLTCAGIPCGHETYFSYDGIDAAIERLKGTKETHLSFVSQWKDINGQGESIKPYIKDIQSLIADSSYLASPFLDHKILKETKFIHGVRNPIKVINSFVNYMGYFSKSEPSDFSGKKYENFIYEQIPDLRDDLTPYDRACLYYVKWNSLIESKLKDREFLLFKVEDNIDKLLKFIDKPFTLQNQIFKDKTVNTFEKKDTPKFSYSHIVNPSIKKDLLLMGSRYGYAF